MAIHLVAVDAGGTAVKVAIYDEAGRECAAAGEVMVPLRPAPGQLERDADATWAAVCRATRKALDRAAIAPASVAAIGLTGYGNGLHLIDGKGRPVRNAVLSPDQRAAGIVGRWRQEGLERGHIALTHQRLWAGKPLPLLAWLEQHEPAVLERAEHALMCKDFLRMKLTGRMAYEVGDMSSGSLLDQRGRTWSPAVLDHLGLGRHARLFGETLEPLALAGSVTDEAAAATGLLQGTPVSAGFSDGPAMLLALGVTDSTQLSVVAGTWGLNQLLTRQPTTDGSINACMHGPRPGDYVLCDGGATSASTFEWFVDTVVAAAAGASDHGALYEWCNAKIADAKDQDPAVYFLPYLNGRLDMPEARGSFVGLSSWHGIGHMIRAVFEGIALEHRAHIDELMADRPPTRVVRFAGGAARSTPWLEIFAAALDQPLEVSEAAELGALGAAIIAAVGAGVHPDLESAAAAMTHVKRRVEPDPDKVAVLARRADTYRALREQLAPVWSRL